MDPGSLKVFVICGGATLVGTMLRYGPRRFLQANHPIQGAVAIFVLGGIGGMAVYPLLLKVPNGPWPFPNIGVCWISILLSVVLTLCLTWAAHQMFVTLRLYRRAPVADAIHTLRYTLRTRNTWIILLPILSVIFFCLVLPLRGVTYPKIIFLPVVLLHLNALALYGTPPSVLLLGSSRWESVRLFNLIQRGIYPYRVVVLLEPSRTEPARHSRHHWLRFEVHNLRILGPHSWRDVVQRIAGGVPIIVLDTRLASPALIEEATQMIREPFRHKTLFVVADDGSAPALTSTGICVSLSDIRTARLHGVVSVLKDMGLTKTTSPDDLPVLAGASFARHSKRMERRMVAVARAVMPFAAALAVAEQGYGTSPFIVAARKLQERLNGKPGDGALEVFAQLSEDIAETEGFIAEWRHADGLELQNVIACAVSVHYELCRLQEAVDQAPPVFLQRNEEGLRRVRGR